MDNELENSFEKFPRSSGEVSGEQLENANRWEQSMQTDVPEFAGNQFGNANNMNQFYGEKLKDEEGKEEYDSGISNAAALINYGLDAAAREHGVEVVIQRLKGFDASGSEDPIRDFYQQMGIDTLKEFQDLHDEKKAAIPAETEFREGVNAPSQKKSVEGAFSAISEMKKLIAEVEGANPKYAELREGARAARKGYFEYAVSSFGTRGLTELFSVLGSQREKSNQEENKNDNPKNDTNDDVRNSINEDRGNNTKGDVVEDIKAGESDELEEVTANEGIDENSLREREKLNPEIVGR